jgi:antitoxin VapB
MNSVQAELFWSEGRQAIRLPKAVRLPGSKVRIRRDGKALVVSPISDREGWGEFWDALVALPKPLKRQATRAAERRKPL